MWPVPCTWLQNTWLFLHLLWSAFVTDLFVLWPTTRCPGNCSLKSRSWESRRWQSSNYGWREHSLASLLCCAVSCSNSAWTVSPVPKLLSCLPAFWVCFCLEQWVTAMLHQAGDISWISYVVCQPKQMRKEGREKRIWSRQFAVPAPFSMELMCVFSLCCVPFHSKCSLLQMSFCELGVGENSFFPFVMFLTFMGISISDWTFAANISGVLAFLLFVIIKF